MSENATPAVIDEAALNASIEKLSGLVTEKTAEANERMTAMEKELAALQQAAAGRMDAVKRQPHQPRRTDRAGPCN